MTDYIRLDTDALDALTPREAYQAATQVHQQAKPLGAAYADRLAADLASEHGQARAADILGIKQPTLAARVTRHKERTMTHTITIDVPAAKTQVNRTWTGTGVGTWTTEKDGTEWVAHFEGSGSGTYWYCGPRGGGKQMPTIETSTVEEALKEATWHLDVKPLIDEAQKQLRA